MASLETPTVIDRHREMVAHRDLKDQKQKATLEVVMSSRSETARRARARLDLESMPISDDASLSKLQEQAEHYLREAKRRDPSESDQLVSTVIDRVARKYFRHFIEKDEVTEV